MWNQFFSTSFSDDIPEADLSTQDGHPSIFWLGISYVMIVTLLLMVKKTKHDARSRRYPDLQIENINVQDGVVSQEVYYINIMAEFYQHSPAGEDENNRELSDEMAGQNEGETYPLLEPT